VGDVTATLTQKEISVLECLMENFPEYISESEMLEYLYDANTRNDLGPKIISVFVCKIRKKLRPLGIKIDTIYGRGYALAGSSLQDSFDGTPSEEKPDRQGSIVRRLATGGEA
jgi:Response regulators consisting of a CheY-like receiver domain and a winged-helix DNA-binding domain